MQAAVNRSFILTILAAGLCLPGGAVLAQDPMEAPDGIPVESDWLYRKHYAQVQKIMQAPLDQRESKLENFHRKLHARAKMRQVMVSFFGQIVKDYEAAGKSPEAKALTARMMGLFPQLKPTPEQVLGQAYQNKNYAQVIELGEKMYATKPDSTLAAMLADSYIATQNGPKALEYSQKALTALGTKEGVYFAVWLAEYYTSQQDMNNALKYYDQLLRTFSDQVPAGWDAQRWSLILGTAYGLRASNAYLKADHKSAIQQYYESLKYSPKNEQAYLFIGLAHWKEQEMPEAMGAFAIATVLDRPGSAKARGYLEQIYKSRNGDSLDGIEELLDSARQALNQ